MLFRVMYLLGITPWEGHPISTHLRDLVEGVPGSAALTPGSALDVGCGTGDTSIYLAQHGWRVTGVDFVPKAIRKARSKAQAAGVTIDFKQRDVTRISANGIGTGFGLITDNGCLHGMSDDDRASYVREVTAVAAPEARLLIVAFIPHGSRGVAGVDKDEIERRFSSAWTLVTTGGPPYDGGRYTDELRYYELQRNR
jgi:2-polyprenyl-3-methyl-5-hydroxy-6-metoxy-1,4-benzoquinol methylase